MDRQRASDEMYKGLDGFVDAMKLQFGVSTGAVALFVHAMFDKDAGTILTAILCAASICFGVSAILCIRDLRNLAFWHALMGAWKVDVADKEFRVAEESFKIAKDNANEFVAKSKVTVWFFDLGVGLSVALLLAKLCLGIALKFYHP
jgi:hypothetical protein